MVFCLVLVNVWAVVVYSTKETTNKDNIVVEMKAEKTEKTVLLKGVNGNNKPPSDQVTIETNMISTSSLQTGAGWFLITSATLLLKCPLNKIP